MLHTSLRRVQCSQARAHLSHRRGLLILKRRVTLARVQCTAEAELRPSEGKLPDNGPARRGESRHMNNPHTTRLDREHCQLLIVDIQERLLPYIHEHETIVASAAKMIRAAHALEVPVTLSEQYPKGLGDTTPAIRDAAGDAPRAEKMTFSFCGDPACRETITRHVRSQVLLVGIETHVCVQQTALDLIGLQMQPVVLADAVGSRRPLDDRIALDRMRHAGVIVTTVESAIFQLVRESGTELFKRILPIVK